LFSNDTAEQAAAQRNLGLQQGYNALTDAYGQGRGALTENYGQGITALQNNYGVGRDALTSNLAAGRDAASANYGQAGNLYAGLGNYFQGLYGGGASAYGDATGANGPEGQARARAAFQTDPGYGFQMDQGLQALQRTHAASGNLASGNADADTLRFSQGLADQGYGNYVSRLQPYLGMAGQGAAAATAGQAGALEHLGNTLNTSYGTQGTGLAANYANQGGLTDAAYQGQGNALNASYAGQGGAANANYTGQGATNAAATMNNYNVGQNQLNAIMGVAKLASGGAGGIGGIGSLASGLGLGGAAGGGGGGASNSFLPSSSFLNNSWGY
jgi:hypothetical protein